MLIQCLESVDETLNMTIQVKAALTEHLGFKKPVVPI